MAGWKLPNLDEITRVAERCVAVLHLANEEQSIEYGYESVPLCIIDAVFSINARYASVQNVIRRYRSWLPSPEPPRSSSWPPPKSTQQTISDFLTRCRPLGAETLADHVFQNRARTSPRSGILKADATLRSAEVLHHYRVEHLQDVLSASEDPDVERAIRRIPGHASGVGWSYFLMLCGATSQVKPDRMVMRFLEITLGRTVDPSEALGLITSACAQLKGHYPHLTPRFLDNRIWYYQSDPGRSTDAENT